MKEAHFWWEQGIIYQIYPRSYMDGDGDGVGDLAGITNRLDHLRWLGVDILWISPFYPSPMADFGYDIADYTAVDPLFGTLDDFDALLAAAHRQGFKILLDFVPNHTSREHPWFIASRSSRFHPRRNWYLWRDPAPGGGPPNNWLSYFGGSAWQWDFRTSQYYYHSYLKQQPDLNWRNPEVQAAMFAAMRFWLARGVDGFRLDAVWNLIKDEQFRDNPPDPDFRSGDWPYQALKPVYSCDRPQIHPILREMRRVVDGYGQRVLLGEIYLPLERIIPYYGESGPEIHLPCNYQLLLLNWKARTLAAAIDACEALLPAGAWPSWVLGNHDKARVVSRIGERQARVAAMLLLTLRGTPTIYYGEELGMHNVPIQPEQVQDPWEKNTPGLGLGRDPVRTPMQWDASSHAGFTSSRPWLPVAADFARNNLESQKRDPASMVHLYRRLIALRKAEPALAVGDYQSLPASGNLLAFIRHGLARRFLVVLNLGPVPRQFHAGDEGFSGRLALSTHLDRQGEVVRGDLTLRGDEVVIVRLENGQGGAADSDH